jgi:hypothetical protein
MSTHIEEDTSSQLSLPEWAQLSRWVRQVTHDDIQRYLPREGDINLD